MGWTGDHPIASAVATVFLLWLVGKLATFFQDRRRYQKLVSIRPASSCSIVNEYRTLRSRLETWYIANKVKPGPPHSVIFGHLISLGKVAAKLPGRAHPHTLSAQLSREYDLPPVFYIDPRPVSIVSLVVTDPYVADGRLKGYTKIL